VMNQLVELMRDIPPTLPELTERHRLDAIGHLRESRQFLDDLIGSLEAPIALPEYMLSVFKHARSLKRAGDALESFGAATNSQGTA
jgi:hypothetical protein